MLGGVAVRTEVGTPQGGPLSPLLANIYLDDLDKELEMRGHKFVRYADDCNIYVRSRRVAERVMESIQSFLHPPGTPVHQRSEGQNPGAYLPEQTHTHGCPDPAHQRLSRRLVGILCPG
jgi:hypothetical protein